MNKHQHTPGPWDYAAKLSGSENHRGFRIRGHGDSWVLADVLPLDQDGNQGEANARLMAAAPELLEALMTATSKLSADGWNVKTYQALIAKALGESQ